MPVKSETIHAWASRTISLPQSSAVPGSFTTSRSKYMEDVFHALLDAETRRIICQWAIQIGKTLVSEIWIAYLLLHSHNNVLHAFQTGTVAEEFADSRLNVLLNSIPEIQAMFEGAKRNSVKKTDINLPEVVSLYASRGKYHPNINGLIGYWPVCSLSDDPRAFLFSRCSMPPIMNLQLFNRIIGQETRRLRNA